MWYAQNVNIRSVNGINNHFLYSNLHKAQALQTTTVSEKMYLFLCQKNYITAASQGRLTLKRMMALNMSM